MEVLRYLVASLVIVVSLAPRRAAYLAFLTLAFFDVSGYSFASASSLGIENTLKIIIVPLILILRMRFLPLFWLFKKRTGGLIFPILLLALYGSLASLWSSFYLSAIKMVGYLLAFVLWFIVVAHGFAKGYITNSTVVTTALLGILAAVFQTFILDGAFDLEKDESYRRFTAFTSPQSFAAFYGFLLAFALFSCKRVQRAVVALVAFVVILMTGSRYVLLASLWILLVWVFYSFSRDGARLFLSANRVLIPSAIVVVGGLALLCLYLCSTNFGHKRLTELQKLISGDFQAIGTLGWRFGMYEEALKHMRDSGLPKLLFGAGTASGAQVALSYEPSRYDRYSIDANRVLHNEFLRTFYEWGVLGLSILTLWIYLLLARMIRLLTLHKVEGYFLLAAMGLIVGGLLIENVLAGAGSPVGIGYALTLSKSASQQHRSSSS